MKHSELGNVLVVGGDSTIGSHLTEYFTDRGISVWSTSRNKNKVNERCFFLDLQNDFSTDWLPEEPFNVAFLCAAITKIKSCNDDPELSYRINVKNTVQLAQHLINGGTFVVFLSTGAVFDGNSAYSKPSDEVNPQTVYGAQKAEAERAISGVGRNNVALVRLSKVIEPTMPLIVKWINDLERNIPIYPFQDMVMAPVFIDLVIEMMMKIAEKRVGGIYHLSADRDVSYYELALFLANHMGVNKALVKPVSYKSAGIERSSKHTTLDCSSLDLLGLASPSPFEAIISIISANKSASHPIN